MPLNFWLKSVNNGRKRGLIIMSSCSWWLGPRDLSGLAEVDSEAWFWVLTTNALSRLLGLFLVPRQFYLNLVISGPGPASTWHPYRNVVIWNSSLAPSPEAFSAHHDHGILWCLISESDVELIYFQYKFLYSHDQQWLPRSIVWPTDTTLQPIKEVLQGTTPDSNSFSLPRSN